MHKIQIFFRFSARCIIQSALMVNANFGALKIGQNNILFFYLRNFVLLGLSLFVFLCYPANQEKTSDRKKIILLGTLLPMLFVAGLTYQMPFSLQQQKPHILLNKHIKDTVSHFTIVLS